MQAAALQGTATRALNLLVKSSDGIVTKSDTTFIFIEDIDDVKLSSKRALLSDPGKKVKFVLVDSLNAPKISAEQKTKVIDFAKKTLKEELAKKDALKDNAEVKLIQETKQVQQTADRGFFETVGFNEATATNDARHSALMAGVGASAGYYHCFGTMAASLQLNADWLLGKFERNDGDDNHLGWGVGGDVGLHYVFRENATMGVIGGFRFGEFRAKKTTDGDAKKNLFTPYLGLEARAWLTDRVSAFMNLKYWIPVDVKLDKEFADTKSKFGENPEINISGIVAGVGMTFHI